jgi:hypothetical protein
LIVTWLGPVPDTARVTYTTGEIFAAAARVTGPETPKGFPEKYTRRLERVDLFNATMSWEMPAVTGWLKRHGIEMEKEPEGIFAQYLKGGHAIFGTLVTHPRVPDPKLWVACSVVLQRGVIVFANGRQTLFLRSQFHSAKDAQAFVNFVPRGGIEVSFASDTIWFPLELTRVIQEPASYVVLDILTRGPLDTAQLPKPFQAEKTGQMQYRGGAFHVTRLTATLAAKQPWPDLRLKP